MSVAKHSTPARAVNGQDGTDAEQYEYQRRAFHLHRSVFAGSMAIIFLVNLGINAAVNITSEWWAWWSVLALLGWGLGLTVHGIVLQMAQPVDVDLA